MWCIQCRRVVVRGVGSREHGWRAHDCKAARCLHCNQYAKSDHPCYMQPLQDKKGEATYIFIDIESRWHGERGKHEPYLIIAHNGLGDGEDGVLSDEYKHQFEGKRAVHHLFSWLEAMRKEADGEIIVFAHNGAGV